MYTNNSRSIFTATQQDGCRVGGEEKPRSCTDIITSLQPQSLCSDWLHVQSDGHWPRWTTAAVLLLIGLDIEKEKKGVGVVFIFNSVLFQPGHDLCLHIYLKMNLFLGGKVSTTEMILIPSLDPMGVRYHSYSRPYILLLRLPKSWLLPHQPLDNRSGLVSIHPQPPFRRDDSTSEFPCMAEWNAHQSQTPVLPKVSSPVILMLPFVLCPAPTAGARMNAEVSHLGTTWLPALPFLCEQLWTFNFTSVTGQDFTCKV